MRPDVAGLVISDLDPHLSRFEHWRERSWGSGFTGMAGTVVITQEKAGLWTDSRYFVQAKQQLNGTGITLFKLGEKDTPTYAKR